MINRNPAFWDRIAAHPEVAPHIFMGKAPESLGPLVQTEVVRPYASEHGGIIFVPVDMLGFVVEMHTLYTPEGWGREVAVAARQFINEALKTASLILTHEQEGYWRSKPPRCHNWQACGDFTDCGFDRRLKLWSLSREGWAASPAGRKLTTEVPVCP